MADDPTRYSTTNPIRIEKYAPENMLVRGNPRQFVQSYFESRDAKFKTGIWSGEKGAYRLEFGPTKYEFFLLIEGIVRVIGDDSPPCELQSGDACVIPPDFSGVFEIIEDAKKYYAISE